MDDDQNVFLRWTLIYLLDFVRFMYRIHPIEVEYVFISPSIFTVFVFSSINERKYEVISQFVVDFLLLKIASIVARNRNENNHNQNF